MFVKSDIRMLLLQHLVVENINCWITQLNYKVVPNWANFRLGTNNILFENQHNCKKEECIQYNRINKYI